MLGKAISAGVVKVVVPPHPPGEVSVMLTLGNGLPLSNAVPFTYRPLLDSEPQQMKRCDCSGSTTYDAHGACSLLDHIARIRLVASPELPIGCRCFVFVTLVLTMSAVIHLYSSRLTCLLS